jgi:hypothetical protein
MGLRHATEVAGSTKFKAPNYKQRKMPSHHRFGFEFFEFGICLGFGA